MNTNVTDRIEKQVILNAPIERVWSAISTAEQFGAWFGVRFEGEFTRGAASVGEFTTAGQQGRRLFIRVVEMEAPNRLAFRWRPHASGRPLLETDEETTLVEFTLESRGDETLLRIVETGFEAIPEAERASNFRDNDAGWDEQMGNLAAYLAPVPDRIEKQTTMRAPIERVWRAVSDAREFGAWFGVDFGEGQFAPGTAIEGKITVPAEYAGTAFIVSVVEMLAPQLLSVRWHPYALDDATDYEAEPTTLIEFRLEPHGEGTRLTITESGFDNIPEDRRATAFRSNDEGWTIQAEQVRKYVDGK